MADQTFPGPSGPLPTTPGVGDGGAGGGMDENAVKALLAVRKVERVVTGDYTVQTSDGFILVDASSETVGTLQTVATYGVGRLFFITNTGTAVANVAAADGNVLAPGGAPTSPPGYSIPIGASIAIESTSFGWQVVADSSLYGGGGNGGGDATALRSFVTTAVADRDEWLAQAPTYFGFLPEGTTALIRYTDTDTAAQWTRGATEFENETVVTTLQNVALQVSAAIDFSTSESPFVRWVTTADGVTITLSPLPVDPAVIADITSAATAAATTAAVAQATTAGEAAGAAAGNAGSLRARPALMADYVVWVYIFQGLTDPDLTSPKPGPFALYDMGDGDLFFVDQPLTPELGGWWIHHAGGDDATRPDENHNMGGGFTYADMKDLSKMTDSHIILGDDRSAAPGILFSLRRATTDEWGWDLKYLGNRCQYVLEGFMGLDDIPMPKWTDRIFLMGGTTATWSVLLPWDMHHPVSFGSFQIDVSEQVDVKWIRYDDLQTTLFSVAVGEHDAEDMIVFPDQNGGMKRVAFLPLG